VGTDGTTAIRIGLHEVGDLRWPKQPLSGDGAREDTDVPLPRLPWSRAAVRVPLGASAARGVERVTRLRKIYGYGVAPLVVLLFVVADVLLIAKVRTPGTVYLVLGVVGAMLVLSGLIPDQVARRTGVPYVNRGHLRIPAARVEGVRQLRKLNPAAAIESRDEAEKKNRT